jgi:hypothetical protein
MTKALVAFSLLGLLLGACTSDARTDDARSDDARSDDALSDDALSDAKDPKDPSSCCTVCSEAAKPCGDTCISRSRECHRGPGCACTESPAS